MKPKLVQTTILSCLLATWVVSFVGAAPLPQIDLRKAAKGLRMPLVELQDGSSAGSIAVGSIETEAQKIGPMRVRALSVPLIRGLVVTLPGTKKTGECKTWPQALLEFLQIDRYLSPVRIEGLQILGSSGLEIVRAKSATFEAEEKRLQMRGAILHPRQQGEEEIERLWLLLEGPGAGQLVWRGPQHGRVETADLLEP